MTFARFRASGPAGRLPQHPVASAPDGLLAYAIVCAAYYAANFLLRWQRHLVFAGDGVYGWPTPSTIHLLGILFGSVAGPLLLFLVAAVVFGRVLRRRALPAFIVVACAVLCLGEVDATWYGLSSEHIRLVDIELFAGLNVKEHLGVDLRDMSHLVVGCAIHVTILVGAGLAVLWTRRRHAAVLSNTIVRRVGAVLTVVIIATGNVAAYVYSVDSAWEGISRSNMLNGTLSALMTRAAPEARTLRSMYASLPPARVRPRPAPPNPAPAPGASILVIALEGWNPDFIDAEMMPATAELARQGLLFREHYSGGDNTLLGVLSLLYGQSPAFFFEGGARGQRSLFLDVLRDQGYRSRYVGRGLSSYRYIDSYMTNFTDGGDPLPMGDPVIRSIAGFVRSHPRSFTFYYYINTHFPYMHGRAPGRYQPEIPDSYQFDANQLMQDREAIRNKYRNVLVRADAFVARLMAALPWRDMIIILTGDHGEAMLETGRLSHSSSRERPETGTPLVLYYPGVRPGTVDRATSHLDVFPTIFEILGLPQPPGTQGRSLLDTAATTAITLHNNQNRRPLLAAVVSGTAKILVDLHDIHAPRFTGLLDNHDHPITVPGHEADIRAGLVALQTMLGPEGCDLLNPGAMPPDSSEAAPLVANLRNCKP